MSFKAFRTRVAPSQPAILQCSLSCERCGRMTAGRIYLALGNRGGRPARGLKTAEAKLPLCENCAGGS